MRLANITTAAGAIIAAAGIANAGIVNVGSAPADVSQHINTIINFSARQPSPRGSVTVVDPATVHSCSDPGSCDAPSVVEVQVAPVESATHCICYPSSNDITARTPNDTSATPPEVTGGAIPQQMQASMAGLLGFFIMCLVML